MASYTIDFFDQHRLLGGTETETSVEKAVWFAYEGLNRHSASWARIVDASACFEKRICAEALKRGHDLWDARTCSDRSVCVFCPVREARLGEDSERAGA